MEEKQLKPGDSNEEDEFFGNDTEQDGIPGQGNTMAARWIAMKSFSVFFPMHTLIQHVPLYSHWSIHTAAMRKILYPYNFSIFIVVNELFAGLLPTLSQAAIAICISWNPIFQLRFRYSIPLT